MKIPSNEEFKEMDRDGKIRKEFKEWRVYYKAHFCEEWDDMLITNEWPEFKCCSCYSEE